MLRDGPVLVQAYFPGRGVGVELLAKDGVTLAAFQHERIHEPPSGGGSSYRRSVPLDPHLLGAAEKIVGALGYTGLIMVEFRVNEETGDWILVETNGRVWGSLPLAINAGVDFPRYLYEMLVEGRSDFSQSYRSGIYCRNITLDIGWLKSNFTADRRDPTQQVLPLRQILSELGNIWKFSERTDTFALDDPLPLLAELRGLAKRGVGYLLQKTASAFRPSILFKHWRARAAMRKLNAAKKVVFVCYGNICRSPFAEAYARATAPGYMEFSSAGTFEDMGRCSPSEAIAAAAAFDVDLARHRSRAISTEAIEAADVIIVFDRRNVRDVLQKFPGAKDHIVLIGDFLPGLSDEIADPFGHPPEYFEDCYRKISNVLTRLARDYWSTPRLSCDYANNSLAAFHELGHPNDISAR
jgi:protein-tyrosine-phosphatase